MNRREFLLDLPATIAVTAYASGLFDQKYQIDVEGIVTAFEHGLVFKQEDIDRLIATNRDFMWNKQVEGAKFRRIDGCESDPRWRNFPGVLWSALVPYDETLRRIFVANHNPAGWGGLSSTPWFLSLSRK